jgi:hypothetical protein
MHIGLHVMEILIKREFSRQIFEKYSNIRFDTKEFSGRRVVSCGQTDERTEEHDGANSRFCYFVNPPKNGYKIGDKINPE